MPGMWAFIVLLLAMFCSGLVLACARDVGYGWFNVFSRFAVFPCARMWA